MIASTRPLLALALILLFAVAHADGYEFTRLSNEGARYARSGNYRRAFDTYEKALTFNAEEPDLYYNLVALGEHLKEWDKVVLYAEGYLRFMQGEGGAEAREVKAKQAAARKEVKVFGTLSVSATPADAGILINGVTFGAAPLTDLSLPAGNYVVSGHKKDYHAATQTVKVADGSPATATLGLEEIIYYGTALVTTKPAEGVSVFVGDQPVGVTPLKDPLKLQANREHVLRFVKEGYDPFLRAVPIQRDKQAVVDVVLEITPGAEAEVW